MSIGRDLLELGTSDQERADALRHIELLEGVASASVSVKSGVVSERLMARYHEAADTLLMDGSTPWEIDEAMLEFGFALGPYAARDLVGLDVEYAKRREQDATRDPARRYIPIADRMVELGKLGRKVGAGWYRYPDGNGRVDDPIVADLGIEEAYFAKVERVEYEAREIRERLLLALINEGADCMVEGVAQSAADIDLVTVVGFSFPSWRGGLIQFADAVGVTAIVEKIEQFAKEDATAWKVSPLLLLCAVTNTLLGDCVLIKREAVKP